MSGLRPKPAKGKIHIFDNGLDDRALEIFKLMAVGNFSETAGFDLDPVKDCYASLEDGIITFELLFPSDRTAIVSGLIEVYREIRTIFLPNFDWIEASPFRIDRERAKEVEIQVLALKEEA